MTTFGTHVRIDLGMVPTKQNVNPPPQGGGGGVGILGGQHFKSPGNFMNCRENR